ncbi:MAG TPA: diguanylate cyclase [Candidatus Polarisedimenticolia bacterium]|nr:diguanylate cyclase [Candidatus Polarisedimenticolia bacterium]
MITVDEVERVKGELLALLDEDTHNEERILNRLSQIRAETGIQVHAALLLILTRLLMEEEEARALWNAILQHRINLITRVGREIGLRVATFDYLLNVNRKLTRPRIIELEVLEEAERSSALDPLTGLYNQRYFRSALQKELRRSRRYELDLALLYMDLDSFREINERHGDLVGDILLKEVAILIKNKIRDIDVAARYSGEEFVLLLPETERMGAYLVAERIRREIERHFVRRDVDGKPIQMTLSVGLAQYPEDATVGDRLVTKAEEALYQSKARGPNGVSVFYRERRDFIRFDAGCRGLKIELRPANGASAGSPSAARNISRSGLLIETGKPYSIGEEVAVRCHDPAGAETITLRGRVVRVEDLEGIGKAERFDVGIAFVLDWEHQEAEIREFLERENVGAGA